VSTPADSRRVFLSAEWRYLIFLNYVVDPSLLLSFVPPGTTLGSFQGKTYLSLVGFRFCKTKLWGKVAVPFHGEFEEVNLRFYVHREMDSELRRGVVFIKEIVPKPAIALTARWAYGENYVSLLMQHKVVRADNSIDAEYSWRQDNSRFRLFASSQSVPLLPTPGSLEQYITEHYWGYSRQKSGSSLEYQAKHIPWPVSVAKHAVFEGPTEKLCGPEFAEVLRQPPVSAYIARGSFVEVFAGVPLATGG